MTVKDDTEDDQIFRVQQAVVTAFVADANKQNKLPFLVDTTGTLGTFFQYQGKTCHVGKLLVGNAMGRRRDATDVADEMRQMYIAGAKYGGTVVYNFGAAFPQQWPEYCSQQEGEFNPEVILDMRKNRTRDHFATVVRMSEDMDDMGNAEIWPKEDMEMCLLIEKGDESTAAEVFEDARSKLGETVWAGVQKVLIV